jgi:ABC-type bacteriocin/lantibiotic exporter with double-glycine peptidase domain
MIWIVLVLVVLNILYTFWITSVLHNMIQGLYREKRNATKTTSIQSSD